ncbi:protocatechuate 3,4-dioxygenase subunit alpha [Corynebacterium frankenforstense]|uniref:protocatechuate 3,4-dioxygenase subunit alpha n=1 Tax=Corynebacterium frankenforstense TaxID=1230998 RepID=UPI00254BFB3E|nr:protocatechuate 3,4-dioxygenase subunit alpha [Corynebacterium frankenforstense]MDK6259372.1 protocatechuate 3,4-dioxygenase subunit alpha [Corynebacterium frankenforstense]
MHIDTGKNGELRYEQSDIRDQNETTFGITPSQTVGPYVHIGLTLPGSEEMVEAGTDGAVDVTFQVTDGAGDPIADAMIEVWQADERGIYNSPLDPECERPSAEGFRGLGRGMVDETGTVTFRTILPGARGDEAPHLNVGVFARGMLERLYTRLYFPQFDEANAKDPVLGIVPESRRGLLVAEKSEGAYVMRIQMQEENPDRETPFFALEGEEPQDVGAQWSGN